MNGRSKLHAENLKTLFNPRSIAVVGTNRVRGTVPGDIFTNILKADVNSIIYPVSPREEFIGGIKAYKYVIDIPDPVDLAVIVFPNSVCNRALEQCGEKGIKSVIIISAGFKEIGEKGLEREKELVQIAQKYGISFIGPNCLGVINTDVNVRLNASFARKFPEEGNIAFLSQSGALCTAVLDYALAKNIGFSKFVSFGNKADISEIDLLYYLMEDEKTKVILLYLEEITDGPGLMKACREVIEKKHKPVLIIKSGRTRAGASAAASHTGSLAGSDEICDAAFRQAGIIRCDNIEEMFNIAIAFAYQPLPESDRMAIITNAGGPGVLLTDATIKYGLHMAQFNENTTLALKRSLPTTANIKNPVDVIGDARADRYNAALSAAFNDPNVDGVFVILTPQSMTDIETIANEVTQVARRNKKPIYTSFMGEADVAVGVRILQKAHIPHYILPESIARSVATVCWFRNLCGKTVPDPERITDVETEEVADIFNECASDNNRYLPEYIASKVLKCYRIPVTNGKLSKHPDEAVAFAREIGFPVVMKVMSGDIVHKFDVKGVFLNVRSEEEVRNTYDEIISEVSLRNPAARIDGIYVTEQIHDGIEVIIGMKRDPSFGTVIMFGLGGIFVELFRDVSFRVAPVSREIALEMINEIKSSPMLNGFRRSMFYDTESIADAIVRIGQLALDFPQIVELDINPLIVLEKGKGCFAADSRIII